MEETNRENPNEQKEQEQMQEREQIRDLLQQENQNSEDQSLTITIPFKGLILKTIMLQIQKREQSKQHFIFNIITSSLSVSLESSASSFFQMKPTIQQWQFILSKSFSHCLFINMKVLYLQNVDFDNCEFMGFLDAPQSRTILMSSNKITNFKSFAKMSLPSLTDFDIQGSLAKTTFLQRTKLPKLTETLELESSRFNFVIEEDLGSLVKFEVNFYKSIRIESKSRVKRDLIMQKLKQRFVKQSEVVELL